MSLSDMAIGWSIAAWLIIQGVLEYEQLSAFYYFSMATGLKNDLLQCYAIIEALQRSARSSFLICLPRSSSEIGSVYRHVPGRNGFLATALAALEGTCWATANPKSKVGATLKHPTAASCRLFRPAPYIPKYRSLLPTKGTAIPNGLVVPAIARIE
ncbi:uncharacterized protein TrAtP1_002129 [Trichoderma atroviride]|uniref:uncharacterized protein n=1 Tax=Hypocrea atroviridis TaxID=63577 RepID=UPI00331F1C6E|nr:hypothetical protein TrAtP1_002129 [Trichoderma atroviride]